MSGRPAPAADPLPHTRPPARQAPERLGRPPEAGSRGSLSPTTDPPRESDSSWAAGPREPGGPSRALEAASGITTATTAAASPPPPARQPAGAAAAIPTENPT